MKFRITTEFVLDAKDADAAWQHWSDADFAIEDAVPGAEVGGGTLEALDPDAWNSMAAQEL